MVVWLVGSDQPRGVWRPGLTRHPSHHLRETSHPPPGVQAGHRPEQQLRMGGRRAKRGTREKETGEGSGTTLRTNEYTTAYSVSTQNGTTPNARGEKKMHSMTPPLIATLLDRQGRLHRRGTAPSQPLFPMRIDCQLHPNGD